jgi:hypothetical protein
MDAKEKVLAVSAIYQGDWQGALAGGAYLMIKKDEPKFLDSHEQVRDASDLGTLVKKLKSIDRDKDWSDAMGFLALQVAKSYCIERLTGRNIGWGGQMTLIGHANQSMIAAGFLGCIANFLDDGMTEKLYKQYLLLENAMQSTLNSDISSSKDQDSATKLVEAWRLVQINLMESFENLQEKIGEITSV